MSRYQECEFCWEEIDTADYIYYWPHSSQAIVECTGCHRKFDVYPDADWDDGGWHDRTTIRPLMALPLGFGPRQLASAIVALKKKFPNDFPR